MNEDKERGMIRKGIVKEMLAKIERQKSLIETSKEERVKEVLKKENSTLEESLRKKLKEEIEQERITKVFLRVRESYLRPWKWTLEIWT